MKYPSAKPYTFGEAQHVQGLKGLLLKAAILQWLSSGEASIQITSRFESLITSLDEII